MNLKGQGALEYLLLIGGAVIVAAVVLSLVTGITGTAQLATESRANDVLCAPFPNQDCGVTFVDDDGNTATPLVRVNGKDPDGAGPMGPAACKVQNNKCVACADYTADSDEDPATVDDVCND
jgi:FlaG/FlaF family flagellin (archaellin)